MKIKTSLEKRFKNSQRMPRQGRLKKFAASLLWIQLVGLLALIIHSTFQSASAEVAAQTAPGLTAETPACHVEVTLDGAIGPASLDLFKRAQDRVKSNRCESLLVLVNTPGGNLQTTRLIVEGILSSPHPVLCLVYPSGGHAGSAGAIIMQACHVAGAIEATNIGAATPVSGGGEAIPDDLRKKLLNDTRSWVEGLAKLRGRSEEFARQIVEDAKAVSATEALRLKAIEHVGANRDEFLKFANGRTVKLPDNKEVKIKTGDAVIFKQDLRYRVMDILMNPQVAYMLFMASLGLLYFEITNPGLIAPGVIGGVGLVLSLVSMHMLDVTWGGVILILVGIAFLIAEAFTAGFGILGVGGVVAFFIGSLFLFDPETTGLVLPLSTILPTTILMGSIMLGIAYLALTSRHRRTHAGFDDIVGGTGVVSEVQPGDGRFGFIEIGGEIWRVTSDAPLAIGQRVKVLSHQGLTLQVTEEKES
jgi:membrane-bound serine protease (ClpP class)